VGAYRVPAKYQDISGSFANRQSKIDQPAIQRIEVKRARAQKIALCLVCSIILAASESESDLRTGKRLTGVNEARYREEYKSSVMFGGV
jgi:hypothetical protein